MNQLKLLSVGLSFTLLSSLCAAFDANTFYIGGALGNARIDIDASYQTKSEPLPRFNNEVLNTYSQSDYEAAGYVFYGGWNIAHNWALEAQYVFMESDDMMAKNLEVQGGAAGLYGVYQFGGDAYVKLLFGVGQSTGDFTAPKTQTEYSGSEVSYSYGLKVGYTVGPGAVEFMYMRYPDLKVPRAEFAQQSSAGNTIADPNDPNNVTNLGGVNLSRRMTTEILAFGYNYTF